MDCSRRPQKSTRPEDQPPPPHTHLRSPRSAGKSQTRAPSLNLQPAARKPRSVNPKPEHSPGALTRLTFGLLLTPGQRALGPELWPGWRAKWSAGSGALAGEIATPGPAKEGPAGCSGEAHSMRLTVPTPLRLCPLRPRDRPGPGSTVDAGSASRYSRPGV